jgi:phosphohistidine phosphatase
MRTLLILRHAKSSWKNTRLADHDRPLNERGRRDAPRIGQLVRDENLVPDLILTSSAERARATAEAVALASGYQGEVQVTRRLYHAAAETYLDLLSHVSDEHRRVMVVGHNPGMAELVEVLTGQSQRMPTAALAQVQFSVSGWSGLTGAEGSLVNLWRPKELG